MMTTALLSMKLARERKGITEIKLQRLRRADHLLEQPELGLVFDVADRQRADPERATGSDFSSVRLHVEAFDAGRRHGVDVGNDQKRFCGCDLFLCQDA